MFGPIPAGLSHPGMSGREGERGRGGEAGPKARLDASVERAGVMSC